MKRLLLVAVLVVVGGSLFAQSIPSFAAFQSAIQSFASGTASALPLETSVGLNWSDAYIGQFPHFGLGLTVGAATLPYSAIKGAISTFQGGGAPNIPSNLGFLQNLGIPVPAYTIDLRIGGFVLPFDIGLKFSYISPNSLNISNFSADYLLLGGDVRYALVKDSGFAPGISVGIGYTYMRGNVSIPQVLNGNPTIQNVSFGGTTYAIQFQNPSLNFFWNSNVIDLKVQLSKNLFIITPFIGLGASFGISNAGGGMQSAILLNGVAPTQTQLNQMNSALGTNYTTANQTFAVTAGANGFATRVFGGFSFNLFILKIGLGAEYEFLSGSFAGMVNARIQF